MKTRVCVKEPPSKAISFCIPWKFFGIRTQKNKSNRKNFILETQSADDPLPPRVTSR